MKLARPQKMQKLYASFLVLAAVISIVSGACLVILLIASNPPESGSVAVATGIVIIPFVISAFVLRAASNSHLCIPCSKTTHAIAVVVVTVVALSWFAAGFVRWPAAPLKRDGEIYTDKRNRRLTRAEYEAFSKWETTLPVAGLPFALAAITALPAIDERRRVRTC